MPGRSDLSELIVADRPSLAEACRALAEAGKFGFDTEFIRERSYVPQVCLIQAATADRVVLIDPFKVAPDAFWELVLDEKVEKIGHACEQDLEMCYRHTHRAAANVFDVQVAAGLAGVGHSLSYGSLVRLALGIETVQGRASSEWARRPLSRGQLEYAVEDVAYLADLEGVLQVRLAELGRQDWLREEMQPLEGPGRYDPQPIDLARRIRGSDRLGGRQLAVLCELVAWRERAARAEDVPPRTLLKDNVLLAAVRAAPASVAELAAVRGFPRPLARQRGQALLEAQKRGKAVPVSDLPAPAARETRRALVTWAMAAGGEICQAAGIDHAVFASRRDYIDLVEALRADRPAPGDLRLLTGWRRQFAGERLRDLIAERLKQDGEC